MKRKFCMRAFLFKSCRLICFGNKKCITRNKKSNIKYMYESKSKIKHGLKRK